MQSELLPKRQVCHLFGGIDPATLYRGIRKGRYPKPLHVGPGSDAASQQAFVETKFVDLKQLIKVIDQKSKAAA